MLITEEIIKAYLKCPYKGYLKLVGQKGEPHIFEQQQNKDNVDYLKRYQAHLIANKSVLKIFTGEGCCKDLEKNHDYIFNASITCADCASLSSNLHITHAKGGNLFSPVLIIKEGKSDNYTKTLLAYYFYILQSRSSELSDYGEIIHGDNFIASKFFFKNTISKIPLLLSAIRGTADSSDQIFSLNKHCKVCEFSKDCHEKAVKSDHLSLISTLKEKDIAHLNAKGIFTLHQLSFTFKPRRIPKRLKNRRQKHFPALKALAIRKNTVYVYDNNLNLPNTPTKIYFDIEGSVDKKFYYLIGMIVENKGELLKKSYWVSKEADVKEVYRSLLHDLEIICSEDFTFFHYGKYELDFWNYLYYGLSSESEKAFVKKIIDKSFDVLPIFLFKIYLPICGNDLKSVSKHIGYQWSSEIISGLHAFVYRKYWEEKQEAKWSEELIRYNLEDCLALKHAVDFILAVSEDRADIQFSGLKVSQDFTEEIKQRYGGKEFGSKNYVISDYDYINKKAYFDYQRDKIFFRTNKQIQKRKSKLKRTRFVNKPNQIIVIKQVQNCIFCGSKETVISSLKNERVLIDLKITKTVVKKWVVRYVAFSVYCPKCSRSFSPDAYRKIGKRYGSNLMSWVVYQYVANNTSFEKIAKTLEVFFHISMGGVGNRSGPQQLKEDAAAYYSDTYNKLASDIHNWNVLHVDETRFRLRASNGYVWVFTNMETVVFLYRPDRTCTFLTKILDNFQGVLISDFYKGYESLNCKQQKCLIHLLRDVNDALFHEQQNNELKLIANGFSELLKKIVTTIDKYGLRKRNLMKHQKDVELFYKKINLVDYRTKSGKALIDRFNRSRKTLFTFLNFDNVPWNNNNAEHSFKHLAIYRKQTNGLFTVKSIGDYLILLSLYQTCKYRGISFLQFLLSKEQDIDAYVKKFARKRKARD
jgi:predicted RecB family nuclease